MPCNDTNQFDGIPFPTGLLKWTGGPLKSVKLSECDTKFNNVVLSIDNTLFDLTTKGMIFNNLNGGAIFEGKLNIDLLSFVEKLTAWSSTISESVTDLSTPFDITSVEIPLNMSCLGSANCENSTVKLLSALEVIVNKLCRHESDIARLKAALTNDFDSGTIYVPQT